MPFFSRCQAFFEILSVFSQYFYAGIFVYCHSVHIGMLISHVFVRSEQKKKPPENE